MLRTWFFIHPVQKWSRTLFTHEIGLKDSKNAQAMELPRDCNFDLLGCRMVQIKDAALIFKPMKEEQQVAVFRLDMLASGQLTWKALPALGRYVESFAVAHHSDGKVYLSGGFDLQAAYKAVNSFDVSMNTWKEAPELNHARWRHTCISMNACLYALGGVEVGSIEQYSVGVVQQWSVLIENQLISRSNAAATQINKTKIAVFGGNAAESDGYVFDTAKNGVRQVCGAERDIKFQTFSNVLKLYQHKFITVGYVYPNIKKIRVDTNDLGTFLGTRLIADYGHIKD